MIQLQPLTDCYPSLSHRVVTSYARSLAPFYQTEPASLEAHAAQQDLYAFFQTLYQALLENPFAFGLPAAEDTWVDKSDEAHKDLQEANRKLAKPREVMELGLNCLLQAGKDGLLTTSSEGTVLILDDFAACLQKPKVVKKFLSGLASVGVEVVERGTSGMIHSPRFPAMLPALQSLAKACAAHPNPKTGKYLFATCNFQALTPGYQPDPLELYRIFNAQEFALVAELHQYFMGKKFKTEIDIHDVSQWVVKYQGNKKIKASPLFQVEYQERFKQPLHAQIKPVASGRIVPLLDQQSPELQEDFFKRKFLCQGDKCNWCRNNKTLGPSALEYKGESYTICWFTNGDIPQINPQMVDLVKQYDVLHEKLG